MEMEDAVSRMLAMATALTAMVYPLVAIVKASAGISGKESKAQGWVISLIAVALCAVAAWGFWSWGDKQEIVLNIFAIILGFGGATGVDRGMSFIKQKG